MGARKLKNNYYTNNEDNIYNDYYIEESAVRKVQNDSRAYELPQEWPQHEIERRRQERHSRKTKQDKELSSVNRGACLILILAIGMTLFLGIDFIKTQTTISSLDKSIIQAEKELTNLKEENRIHKEQLSASLDLQKVYDIATNEYGMVRPSDDQVIYFDSTLTEFVKQYGEIPSNVEASIIDDLFK
ncbi:MAG: hypothetical protein GX995_09845 [Clostridiales bacterium]|jgi:cell division protein FtsL|nr:hypothetical protein [Clostridiales bacterium]